MKKLILPFILASALPMASFGALNRDGILGIDKTFSAQTMHHGKLGIGLHTQVVNDETVVENSIISNGPGAANAHKISDYLTASSSIFLSLGLGPYTDIGLAMPFYYEKFKADGGPLANMDQQYNGDLRYRLKVRFPFSETQVLDVAVLLGGSVPTQPDERGVIPRELEYFTNDPGTFNEGSSPFGAGRPTFLGALGMTLDLGQVAEKFQFLWHFNLGFRKTNISRTPPFDDVLFWSTAAEYEAASFIRFFAQFYHESRFDHLGDEEYSTEPTTLTVGGVGHTPVGLEFYAGVIFGFDSKFIPVKYNFEGNSGSEQSFNMKGASDVSMFFQICWNGFILKQDNDNDGIKNKEDNCPDDPEDKDGFQDEDGCPDPDNDKDGVPDIKDKCPNDAQGPDGKEGCPNLDKDNDGIPDISDKCPNDPEDKDGFEDEDGCPDPDNDKDGFADAKDRCPNAPETVNGFEDEDGCPDKVSEIVKTLVLKGVSFKTGSAELTTESYAVLDDIVPQLKAYPEMSFEVAGHTDNRGNPTKNQMLSQARAQTVANYFISKGVEAKQLKVMGYGSSRPLGPNTSAEGRALNRRVELNRIK